MSTFKLPRRVFLKGLGIILLTSGCSADIGTLWGGPTATPQPSPTPTPMPRADAVVQTYLSAWQNNDFATMYGLLSPSSQARITPAAFQAQYKQAMTEATVEQINIQIQSLLHDGQRASALFQSNWQTHLFETIQANNQMQLVFEDGRWGIEWQRTLILPQLGEGVTLAFIGDLPTRGNIYDKNFHALAAQGEVVTIGVVPQFIQDEPLVVEQLTVITNVQADKIRESMAAARPDWFVPIKDVTFETSLEYNDLLDSLAGVERRAKTVRTYTDVDTASHVIGYMGAIAPEDEEYYISHGYRGDELVGLTGVEAWGEQYLAGQRGGRLVTLAPLPSRQVMSELSTVTSRAGSSVYLTLDTVFQATVERLLGERKGSAVVMNPDSGAIYAMATYPRFKPAVFASGDSAAEWTALNASEDQPLVNRATQGLYPPGSVFKIASLAAALDKLGLDPATTFTCTGKWHGLGEAFEKTCWLESGHGRINLIDGLTQSCNVVFYEVGLALHRSDPQLLPDLARAFGLGVPTDILGVEEGVGVVPDDAWKNATLNQPLFDGDAVNTAIGQGFTLVTPIQIARMLAAVGNGGQLVRPYVVERISHVDGGEEGIDPEISGKLPIKAEVLNLIRDSLEEITSGARGTARQAFAGINYTVAGKTGTAESGQKEPHSWFAGYAPADKPRVVVAVIVEHAGEGSQVAAPLSRQVIEAFFDWEASQTKAESG
ncbi:MAG: penicillin-binding protein 2 [Anaerolineae bacterium]|nr:penicillin-binding protein 2 [Anaerolineae bacterium]